MPSVPLEHSTRQRRHLPSVFMKAEAQGPTGYDALIVAAAEKIGCLFLFSKDIAL